MMGKLRNLAKSLLVGFAIGVSTAAVTVGYKWLAEHLISANAAFFDILRTHWRLALPAVLLFAALGILLARIYRRLPDAMGGGIPNCIAEVRGVAQFNAIKALFGTIVMSLGTFLLGVPLGTEGSCVQIGGALGKSVRRIKGTDEKNLVVSGACAGFGVATGSPFGAILFAFEEFSQRPPRQMFVTALSSVFTACAAAQWLLPKMGLSVGLFPQISTQQIGFSQWWRVLLFAVVMGLFAWLFLKVYQKSSYHLRERRASVPLWVKMSGVLAATVICGTFSHHFISSGTDAVLMLFSYHKGITFLIALVAVRMMLSVSANTVGFCGGIFIPTIAVGTAFAAILLFVLGVPTELSTAFLCLGVTACIAGILQMPLTAVAFTLEVFGCLHLLLPVSITAAVTFSISKASGAKSINEITLSYKKKQN